MHNISTIYRFNTPFLDLKNERERLIFLTKKIEKSIEFDGIKFEKSKTKEGNYYKIVLNFVDKLGKIEFFYISEVAKNIYHLPIFKLNIFVNNKFLSNNNAKTKAVKFLNNIFECFDGLDEKEFLIDMDNSIYYTSGFFKTKKYPNYDFSDIEKIRKLFENEDGIILIEDFIKKFSLKNFELTYEKANYYHTLHGTFLYFIYLVFLMYQNIEKTNSAKKELEKTVANGVFEGHISLIQKRLLYVEQRHKESFNKYKNRLELFFKMF